MSAATLPRADALALLARHGWTPDALTATGPDGAPWPGSSFLAEMGDRDEYDRAAFYRWLGY